MAEKEYFEEVSISIAESDQIYKLFVPVSEVPRMHQDEDFAAQVLRNHLAELQKYNSGTPKSTPAPKPTCVGNKENVESNDEDEEEEDDDDDGRVPDKKRRKPTVQWSFAATCAMIEEMGPSLGKIDDGMQKKDAFQAASEVLLKAGFKFTADQVCRKWNKLRDTYKKRIEASEGANSTGKGPLAPWKFHARLHVYLYHRPEINPKATLSSTGKRTELDTAGSSTSSSSRKSDSPTTGKRDFTQFLESHKKREEAKERRHQERMQLERRKLELKEKMLDEAKSLKGNVP